MKPIIIISQLFIALLAIQSSAAFGQTIGNDSVSVHATRAEKPPKIDGVLDDPVWQTALPAGEFTQKEPNEGVAPTQRTEVRILYDDSYIYVGARMYDSAPDSIVGCLVRRDYGIDSDGFWVDLDTYHDHQTAYYFALDPTGSLYDGTLYNDNWEDNTWDGVWLGKTSRDSLGWCAEFKIPFTQLRFQKQDSLVWGINFWRWMTRRHETSYLAYTPLNESGFVSRFPHLTGLKDIRTPRYIELLPYLRAKTRFRQTDNEDPFHNDAEFDGTGGLDAKVGLGSNLVLDATINPDFGQVEVDPAVVNLTDVETYFDEKRPFFIEGSRHFNFGIGGSSSYNAFNWSDPTFFYSRRIGRAPQGSIPYSDFMDSPDGTRIWGAGKITGTLVGDWKGGSIHAVTAKEVAKLETDNVRSELEIEPTTYYTVNRFMREYDGGFRGIGGLLTNTHRFFKDDALKNQMNSNSLVGGIDGWTFLDQNRTYVISGWAGASHVSGNEARLLSLQKSSTHYFQRPDASHVELDSSATSMTGYAGRLVLNKERGNWLLHSTLGAIDPSFDVNDLGYIGRTDILYGHLDCGYRWTKPASWRQSAQQRLAVSETSDFGGKMTNFMVRSYSTTVLRDFSGLTAKLFAYPIETYNNTKTRGGPRTKNPPSYTAVLIGSTDSRKPVELYAETSYTRVAGDDYSFDPYLSIRLKPASNLNIDIGPTLSLSEDVTQWVGAFPDPKATATYGKRYIFSSIKYTELGTAIRTNWTFTPRLSVHLFLQPFFSSGDYNCFKQLVSSGSNNFDEFPQSDISEEGGIYTVDPDGSGPAESFQFYNPDFSMNSMRANFIMKWEYMPGSSLYFVWTHGREYYEDNGEFELNRSIDQLVDANPDDIFMLKTTYWFSR
jgi:hypothetical protein